MRGVSGRRESRCVLECLLQAWRQGRMLALLRTGGVDVCSARWDVYALVVVLNYVGGD